MNLYNEIREQFRSELDRSSVETIRVRLWWCDNFLSYARDVPLAEWDKRLVNDWVTQLEKHYKPGTVRYAFGVAKRMFDAAVKVQEREKTSLIAAVNPSDPTALARLIKALHLPSPQWDFGKRAAPPAPIESMTRPALTFEEIERIVTTARDGKLDKPQVAYTALASVYGLRVGELRQMRGDDINFCASTIFVKTEKHGQKRGLLLCDEIVPYLKYDFHIEYSKNQMFWMFKDICERAGVRNESRKSFHSYRRYLDTALRDALSSDPEVKRDSLMITRVFFRWAGNTSEMSDRYYTANPLEADRLALSHNPVVELWR